MANYDGTLPLSKAQLREWAVLDTFDWLSPRFDNPQNLKTVRRWTLGSGLTGIEIQKLGHLVARGNQAPAGRLGPHLEPKKFLLQSRRDP